MEYLYGLVVTLALCLLFALAVEVLPLAFVVSVVSAARLWAVLSLLVAKVRRRRDFPSARLR